MSCETPLSPTRRLAVQTVHPGAQPRRGRGGPDPGAAGALLSVTSRHHVAAGFAAHRAAAPPRALRQSGYQRRLLLPTRARYNTQMFSEGVSGTPLVLCYFPCWESGIIYSGCESRCDFEEFRISTPFILSTDIFGSGNPPNFTVKLKQVSH